jgi:hypothetical protein
MSSAAAPPVAAAQRNYPTTRTVPNPTIGFSSSEAGIEESMFDATARKRLFLLDGGSADRDRAIAATCERVATG